MLIGCLIIRILLQFIKITNTHLTSCIKKNVVKRVMLEYNGSEDVGITIIQVTCSN